MLSQINVRHSEITPRLRICLTLRLWWSQTSQILLSRTHSTVELCKGREQQSSLRSCGGKVLHSLNYESASTLWPIKQGNKHLKLHGWIWGRKARWEKSVVFLITPKMSPPGYTQDHKISPITRAFLPRNPIPERKQKSTKVLITLNTFITI